MKVSGEKAAKKKLLRIQNSLRMRKGWKYFVVVYANRKTPTKVHHASNDDRKRVLWIMQKMINAYEGIPDYVDQKGRITF